MIPEGVIYARASTPTYSAYPTGSLPSCSFTQLHHDLTFHGAGVGDREKERERERERRERQPGGMTSNDTMNNSL